jgi:hypothetical protein
MRLLRPQAMGLRAQQVMACFQALVLPPRPVITLPVHH